MFVYRVCGTKCGDDPDVRHTLSGTLVLRGAARHQPLVIWTTQEARRDPKFFDCIDIFDLGNGNMNADWSCVRL